MDDSLGAGEGRHGSADFSPGTERMVHMPKAYFSAAICAMVVLLSASAGAQAPFTGIRWMTDLDAARVQAEKEGKLLLVHFWTDGCGPCVHLDSTVFNQPSVGQVIHESYVPVKLNAGEFPATAERFGVTRVPMEVVVTPAGHVVEKFVAPATPMAYIGKLGQLAHGYHHNIQRNAGTATVQGGPATQPLNSAYAGLSVPPGNPLVANETHEAANGFTENPYAAAVAARQGQGANTAPANTPPATAPAAAQPAAPAPVVQSQPETTMNRYAQETVAPPATQPAPEAAYPVAPQPAKPAGAVVSKAELEEWAKELKLPPGSPELGFYGYCPVTMKHDFRWERGNAQWGAIHRGRTYLFSSETRRSEFLKDPDAYAPALSGLDPVLAIDRNQGAPGLRRYAVEYNGQFYLFSSEETLKEFWSKAESYSTEVRHAMNRTGNDRIVR